MGDRLLWILRPVVCGAGFALLLTSCAEMPWHKPAPPQEKAQPAPDLAAQQEREKAKLNQQRQEREQQRQGRINNMLAAAHNAYADNRLTLPAHDNAFDRYAAVLLLDPDNREAKAGLQAVQLSYVDLIRTALRDNRVDEARRHLQQAQQYFSGSLLLDDLQKEIGRAQERYRQQLVRVSEQDLQGELFPLPAQELSRKSIEIRGFLAKVARRLEDTDESVLIMARTDAEGRWIYQQMNDAVPDYRIRGDIRVTSTPQLQLMPPL